MFTYIQEGSKEERSDKDSASKDGKGEKADGKAPGKDAGKDGKAGKDAKDKGRQDRKVMIIEISVLTMHDIMSNAWYRGYLLNFV